MSAAHSVLARRRQVTVPLLRRDSIGEAYHVLTFDDPAGGAVQPGQFLMVRGADWGEAPLLPRPMSYLSGGTTPSILVKVVGEGTARMGRAAIGEPYTLVGPLGTAWSPLRAGQRPLLVGGGVGIAPLLFLAQQLQQAGVVSTAIYGGRGGRDLPLDDDLAELAELHLTTQDGSRGRLGVVTDVLEQLLERDHKVYTCGPEKMMARVAAICAARGADCDVSLETPMACGYGVCLGCPVPAAGGGYLYACTEGPCIDATRIEWARACPTSGGSDASGRAP